MRPEVRSIMRDLEWLTTAELARRASDFNPFGPDYRQQPRTALLNINLRIEYGAKLEADEGWES